jgi:hypothetical protein
MAELERIRGERAAEVRGAILPVLLLPVCQRTYVRLTTPSKHSEPTPYPNPCTPLKAERRAAEEEARREKEKEEALRTGNPLLAIAGGGGAGGAGGQVDFGVKRRWDEDVVFKNTTRGEVKVGGRVWGVVGAAWAVCGGCL